MTLSRKTYRSTSQRQTLGLFGSIEGLGNDRYELLRLRKMDRARYHPVSELSSRRDGSESLFLYKIGDRVVGVHHCGPDRSGDCVRPWRPRFDSGEGFVTDIILTRDEVAEIKSANQLSNGAQPLSGNQIESLISTIDHLYAQRDALMRVKDLASSAEKFVDDRAVILDSGECLRTALRLELAAYAEAEKNGFIKDSPNA